MNTEIFTQAQKLRNNGEIEKAIDLYEKAREQALTDHDALVAAECLHMIGVSYYQKQKYDDAEAYLQSAQEEFESHGNQEFFGFVLRDRGMVARGEQKLDRAELLLRGSVEVMKKMGNTAHEGISRVKLGRVYADQERFEDAIQSIKEGISLLNSSNDDFFLSSAYLDLAKVLIQKNDKLSALRNLEQSLEILNSFAKEEEFLERRRDIKKLQDELTK